MGLPRLVALLVALAVAVGPCAEDPSLETDPEGAVDEEEEAPGPSGVRAAVVLPPGDPASDPQLAAVRTDLEAAASLLPDGVMSVRLVVPDDKEFAVDVAGLLAQADHDLVCVLGPDAHRIVIDLADLHPERRLCAAPAASTEAVDGVDLVEVRYEELGYAAGTAAVDRAGGEPIGLVLGSDRTGRERFRDGVRAAVGDGELVERTPDETEDAEEVVADVLDADARVVVADLGAGGGEMLELLVAGGAELVVPHALTGGDVAEATVLSWRVRWAVVLRPVLSRMVDPDTPVPGSVGFDAEVFWLTPGPAAGLGLRTEVDRVVEELADGRRDPLEPIDVAEPDDGDDGDNES